MKRKIIKLDESYTSSQVLLSDMDYVSDNDDQLYGCTKSLEFKVI